MIVVKKKKNQRYFSKSNGQFSVPILFHLSHPPWPIRGGQSGPGGGEAGHGEGAGDGVRDASRSPLSKGLGLSPNVALELFL